MRTLPVDRRAAVSILSILAASVLLGACSPAAPSATPDAPETPAVGAPTDDAPTDGPTDEAPAGDDMPSELPETEPIVASWDPAAPPTDLGGGFTLADCEGDAPALCVLDGSGTPIGLLEDNRYPVPADLAGLTGEELDAALREFAAERWQEIAEDRRIGCGEDHETLPDAPGSMSVGGGPGLRYGVTTLVGGEVVERNVIWATVRGEELRLVAAPAVAPGSCMDGELLAFTPDQLAELLPVLDRVMAGTPLPA